MAVPMILAFNLSADGMEALRGVCGALGLRAKAVPRESFSMPLGGMVGLQVTGAVNAVTQGFDDPMLVMCGLDEHTLDTFLRVMRYSAVPPIPLKAILTPTNAAWSALTLHEELCREHEQMQRMRSQKRD